MTEREWFKAAFLYRCAEHGLSVEETRALAQRLREVVSAAPIAGPITKEAQVEKTVGELGKGLAFDIPMAVYEKLWGVAKPLMLLTLAGAPLALGYAGGNIAGDIVNAARERDLDELKKQEKLDAYYRELEAMKLRNALRQSGTPRRSGRMLM